MAQSWDITIARWVEAGVIDREAGERIREFERAHAGTTQWRWPIWLALAFGALLVGAGLLLFVSAHWDSQSPTSRFVIVLVTIALFHVAAAVSAPHSRGMATALHALGTVACGAGVFLSGQIFNLAERWPSGVMLWAVAAIIAASLLKDWAQLVLAAVLIPAWLQSEWFFVAGNAFMSSARVAAAGNFLLALAYFSAVRRQDDETIRQALRWIGGILLLPSAIALAASASRWGLDSRSLSAGVQVIGWTVAFGAPAVLAMILRRSEAWPNLLAAAWVAVLLALPWTGTTVWAFAWWGAGAAALAAWGIRDARPERINVAAVIFAATTLSFYFSHVMTKIGRSASLIGLGILFLGGGWALERMRRHFVRQVKGAES